MSHNSLQLLGAFQLVLNSEPVALAQARLRELIAFLVLRPGIPTPRAEIAFQFWPDSSEKQARTNLRKTLVLLRRCLPELDTFLQIERQQLLWRTDAPCIVDVIILQSELAAVQMSDNPSTARLHLERVVDLYAGELLPGCYDDWIIPVRERLRQAYMEALDRFVNLLEEQRDYEAAVSYAQRTIIHDPLHEAGYLQLMRLHLLQGERARSLRVYHRCATVLLRELGVEPNDEIEALYAQLLALDELPAADRAQIIHSAPTGLAVRLIGRQSEWNTLRACWQGLKRRPVHVVILTGEAGIGKTRLCEELLNWAERQGFATARARAYATEGGLAYAPISDWLRTPRLNANTGRLSGPWLTEIARLLPEILEQHPALPTPRPFTEPWQRQRLYSALAQGVLAGDQPLLLALDDIQWCDGETLTWLHYFLRYAQQDGRQAFPNARLLLVCTLRDDEIDANHPFHDWRVQLFQTQQLTELALNRLTQSETELLAQEIMGRSLPSTQVDRLFADTGGNPLYITESMRAVEDESISGAAIESTTLATNTTTKLLANVYALMQARLSRLSPQAQEMAGLAAVIGRTFRFELLAAASTRNEDEVVQAIEELWQRRIIEDVGDGYDYSHDRLRDVTYAELSRPRRRLLHRRVAEALQQVRPRSADDLDSQLAIHYDRAGLGERATGHYLSAGEQALESWAAEQAIAAFSRAGELASDVEQRARVGFGLARARFLLDQRHVALADVAQALALLKAPEHPLRPQLLYLQADLLAADANPDAAEESVRAALAIAQRIGDQNTVCQSLSLLGVIHSHRGELDAELDLIEQALAISRATGNHWREARTQADLAFLHAQRGEFPQAIPLAQAALNYLESTSDRGGVAFGWNILGRVHGAMGNFDRAFAAFENCREVAEEIGLKSMSLQIPNMLGWLHHQIGDYAGALALNQVSVEDALRAQMMTPEISARLNVCHDRLELDGPGMALAELAQIEIQMAQGQYGYHEWRWRIRLLHIQALCHLRLHEPARVLTIAEDGAALARHTSARKYIALYHELAGAALASQEQWVEADDEFAAAVRVADTIECRPISMRARTLWATVHRNRGNEYRANALLAEAKAIATTIAADISDDALRAVFLASSGCELLRYD